MNAALLSVAVAVFPGMVLADGFSHPPGEFPLGGVSAGTETSTTMLSRYTTLPSMVTVTGAAPKSIEANLAATASTSITVPLSQSSSSTSDISLPLISSVPSLSSTSAATATSGAGLSVPAPVPALHHTSYIAIGVAIGLGCTILVVAAAGVMWLVVAKRRAARRQDEKYRTEPPCSSPVWSSNVPKSAHDIRFSDEIHEKDSILAEIDEKPLVIVRSR